jgi:hypothetical protein
MKHRNCNICGKPIILVPSAAERARKYGETADYYKNLFTTHDDCLLNMRAKKASDLMQWHRDNPGLAEQTWQQRIAALGPATGEVR